MGKLLCKYAPHIKIPEQLNLANGKLNTPVSLSLPAHCLFYTTTAFIWFNLIWLLAFTELQLCCEFQNFKKVK